MGFLAHEITANPEVQEKLFAEIQAMEDELDGKNINYDQIQTLKYMDQVVCETLRKWPAAQVRSSINAWRVCCDNFYLDDGSSVRQRLCA